VLEGGPPVRAEADRPVLTDTRLATGHEGGAGDDARQGRAAGAPESHERCPGGE